MRRAWKGRASIGSRMTDQESPRRIGNLSAGVDGVVDFTLRYDSFHQAEDELGPFLTNDGIFCATGSPLEPSTVVRIRVELPDDVIIIQGTGVVFWTRDSDEGPSKPAGMAVRFASLAPRSKEIIEKLVQSNLVRGGAEFELEPKAEEKEDTPAPAATESPKKRQGTPLKMSLKVREAPGAEAKPAAAAAPTGTPEEASRPDFEKTDAAYVPDETEREIEELTFDLTGEAVPEGQTGDIASLEDQVPVAPTEASPAAPGAVTVSEPLPQPAQDEEFGTMLAAPASVSPVAQTDVVKSSQLPDEPAVPSRASVPADPQPAEPSSVPVEPVSPPVQPAPEPEPEPVPIAESKDEGITWLEDTPAEELDLQAEQTTPASLLDAPEESPVSPIVDPPDQPEPLVQPLQEPEASVAEPGPPQPEQFKEPAGPLEASLEAEPTAPSPQPLAEPEPEVEPLSQMDDAPTASLESPAAPPAESEPAIGPNDWATGGDTASDGKGFTVEWKTSPPAGADPAESGGTSSEGIGNVALSGVESAGPSGDLLAQPSAIPGAGTSARRGGGAERRKRGGLTVFLILLVVLVGGTAAVWFVQPVREKAIALIGEYIPGGESIVALIEPDIVATTEPVEGPEIPMVDDEEPDDSEVTPPALDTDPEPVRQEPRPIPTRQTVRQPVSTTAASGQSATGVGSITWTQEAGATRITIRGDGTFSEQSVSVSPMSSPPRVLIRLRRVETFPKYEMSVGTFEVEKIRLGFHPELNPPALYVVVDLGAEGAQLQGHRVEGDRVIVTIGSR